MGKQYEFGAVECSIGGYPESVANGFFADLQ